jgi:hypothetical protein
MKIIHIIKDKMNEMKRATAKKEQFDPIYIRDDPNSS